MTAPEILERVVTTYASARSYADRGKTRIEYKGKDARTEIVTFSTAFVRPAQFRFEYRDEGDAKRAHIIWLTGGTSYRTWYLRPDVVEADADLEAPLTATIGTSRGLTFLVPSLLMPELGAWLHRNPSAQLEGDETIAGRPCWRLRPDPQGPWTIVWIDKQTYGVRRIAKRFQLERSADGPPLEIEQTIDFEPRLNEPIAEAALRGPDISRMSVHRREPPKWIGVLFEQGTTTIKQVLRGAPAAHAGMRTGDRIVSFAGKQVADPAEVIASVAAHRAGDRIHVVIERGGKQVTVTVAIAQRPDMDAVQRSQLLDKQAPDFSLQSLDGRTVKLSHYRGKVVVIDFWATWCKPCIAALPHLNAWHQKLGPRGLVIIGITDEESAVAQPFVTQHKLAYPVVLDPAQDTWRSYLVQGIPTTVIVDKAGVVRFVETGLGDPALAEAAIAGLLIK